MRKLLAPLLTALALALVLGSALTACSDGGGDGDLGDGTGAAGGVGAADGDDGQPDDLAGVDTVDRDLPGDELAPDDTSGEEVEDPEDAPVVPESGLWQVRVEVVELQGFILLLQLDVTVTANDDGTGVFDTMAVRVVYGGEVSEDLAAVTDVAWDETGAFVADFGDVVLPGEFTITGSDVDLSVALHGWITASDAMCGELKGEIKTLMTPLEETTFGAIPHDAEGEPPTSCADEGGGADLPRLTVDACPDLVAGINTGFPSGGLERTVEIQVPADLDALGPVPVVFLFHGLTDSPENVLSYSGYPDRVDDLGFVLVAPTSTKQPVEWDQLTSQDGVDLALFDDLVTCLGASFEVDPDRVHVSGMSAGGLFATYLSVMRGDEIASSAPMSGGLLVPYPEPEVAIPMLFSWGGEEDVAVGQDFHLLATALLDELSGGDHFVVACDHGLGHMWPDAMTDWALAFLLEHPRGVDPSPWAAGLPEGLPDYCVILGE